MQACFASALVTIRSYVPHDRYPEFAPIIRESLVSVFQEVNLARMSAAPSCTLTSPLSAFKLKLYRFMIVTVNAEHLTKVLCSIPLTDVFVCELVRETHPLRLMFH